MIKAVGNFIIVKPIKPEKIGKLLLPGDDKPEFFEVVSVGDEVHNIKILDRIYMKYGFQKVPYKDEELYYTTYEDIYAKRAD